MIFHAYVKTRKRSVFSQRSNGRVTVHEYKRVPYIGDDPGPSVMEQWRSRRDRMLERKRLREAA